MKHAAVLCGSFLAGVVAVVAVIWLMVWAAGTQWAAPVGLLAVFLIASIDLLGRGSRRV